MGSRSRFVTALLGACLLLPAATGAASASTGTTYWVDTDGVAGPASCAGPGTASTTIQAAVDVTVPGDTVKVCPGTYRETVVINGYSGHAGISLVSIKKWAAVIYSPADLSGGSFPGNLLTIYAASHVTVQGFKLVARTWGPCTSVGNAIDVTGNSKHALIDSNFIRPTGAHTFDGVCQLDNGIRVEGPSTARIQYNLIKDWLYDGINVTSNTLPNDADVWVKRNSLRSRHLLYSGGECLGIGVESTGDLVMKDNALTEPAGLHYCGGTGVWAHDGGIADVSNNLFNGFRFDIHLSSGTAANVGNNVATATPLYGKGIWVDADVSGATIHDNDARGNADTDCQDDSSGGGTLFTANTWTNNRGTTLDVPDGICSNP